MIDLWFAAVLYCTLVAGAFVGLWLWYDRRDQRRFELERRKVTFHCIRCDLLYSAPPVEEPQPCPRCRHANSRLRF